MDVPSESVLKDLKDKYLQVKNLLEVKTDPENEPYKSQYQAREILHKMSKIITDSQVQQTQNTHLSDLLAIIYCMISSISYDVDELAKGKEFSKKVLQLVSSPIHPARITCSMTCLNLLGFWACQGENFNKSLKLLEQSESLYNKYNNEIKEKALEFDYLFTGDSSTKGDENSFEKCHTQTLFYLAQVYAKTDIPAKSAKYCHITLKRQLEAGDDDVVEWALNTATLSQFLIEQNAFKEARHHLAASLIILQKHNLKMDELLNNDVENEELKAKKEKISYRLADIYRCWAKYSIFLLNASKDRLLSSEDDKIDPAPEPPELLKGLKFPSLVQEVKELEKDVTADFILTYEDAKPLFQKSQEWLNFAKEYYTLEYHATEYSAVIQDSSKLYQLLAFFQPDEAIQCKLHKRRIDMLSDVVNELNSTHYLKICREIWFEIGEACMTMADIKSTQAKESKDTLSEEHVQHCAIKVKNLILQGIKYLEEFVKSFKLKSKDEKYPEGFEKTIILGYMYLGHMYSRVNEPDKVALINRQEESLHSYSAILDYCTAHPDLKQFYAEEYSICLEMVELIPLKIRRLKSLLKSK